MCLRETFSVLRRVYMLVFLSVHLEKSQNMCQNEIEPTVSVEISVEKLSLTEDKPIVCTGTEPIPAEPNVTDEELVPPNVINEEPVPPVPPTEDGPVVSTCPILTPNPHRFVIFPIKYQCIWDLYKQHVSCFWVPSEIDFSKDRTDWENLNDNERYFIKNILAFFACSDGIIIENLVSNFCTEVQLPEARAFYTFQIAMEQVHSETYSLMIDSLIKDPLEKQTLLEGIETIPAVIAKAEWAVKHMNPDASFAKRLVAFACVEGIFFSGSFCAIFWLKKRGLMSALTFSNELIARDESLHCLHACLIYSLLHEKISQAEILEIVTEAVACEKWFITDSLPVNLIGMNNELMLEYIEFVSDYLLVSLGCQKHYNTANPFNWMDMISMQGKTNFFESRVSSYQKANVMQSANGPQVSSKTFDTAEDF